MDDMVVCPECDIRFQVVWCNDGFSNPGYCPMCGSELDYAELCKGMEDENE